ncbi:conserved hypothetical protein [Ricinus communis]|uniref:Uncharacterized protein n=1 Tax=Ricinus communis TaxID=3988 RepID=B9RVH1_RICCO|nr:conserved hypothetical protein [Ricinus communis]
MSVLHESIRSRLATNEGTSFRGLVEKALEVERLHKKKQEIIQKCRKYGQSSFQSLDERLPRVVVAPFSLDPGLVVVAEPFEWIGLAR